MNSFDWGLICGGAISYITMIIVFYATKKENRPILVTRYWLENADRWEWWRQNYLKKNGDKNESN